ncbi:MAG: extracellular solute-binding protein [Chloroflexi bacterium]|nr:extracellular solute-binding protein [Chloroflexota bacterium]
MRKVLYLLVALILASSLVAACTGATSPAGTPPPATAPAKGAAGTQAADWQKKWDSTLAAAKKEGTLTIYGEINPELRESLVQGFEKKYDIKLEFVIGKSAELSARWEREYGAGIKQVDVFHMGGGTAILAMKPKGAFAPLEPYFILPEVTDPGGWRGGKVNFLDEARSVIALNAAYTTYVGVNTDLVKEGQIKSYRDLLKPEWKGKVVLFDPSIPGAGAGWATFAITDAFGGLEAGKEFMRQFAATQPEVTRDVRTHVEWVAKGKYAVGVGAQHATLSEFKAMGAPITINRMVEGGNFNPGSGCLEVSPYPVHPNATAVYVNWILSKDGQAAFARGFGSPPVRIDVPAEGIDPSKMARPEDKAFLTDEKFFQVQGDAIRISREIFGPLLMR